MDNREAKFILGAYRPGGQDANDRRFVEALEQARRDSMLQRWFQDSIAFDTTMTDKLRAIEVPRDLQGSILTGVKVSRSLRSSKPLIKWAIAAVFFLSVILGSLVWRETRPAHLAGWQNEALGVISSLVRNESRFDIQSHKPAELVSWLHSNHAPVADKLPSNLDNLESLGCKTFSCHGVPVSVICFMRPDGGLLHLLTTNASPLSDRVFQAEAKFVQQGEWATATWREGERVYMLALEGSRDQLQSYLL